MKTKYLIAFISLVLVSTFSAASELPLQIDPFPDSTEEFSESKQGTTYRWVYSPVKKVSNQFIADEEERVKGNLSRAIWVSPSGFTADFVHKHYLKQIMSLGSNVRYDCAKRGCGRSHVWATQIFKYPNLYGLDDHQYYATGNFSSEGFSGVWVLYTAKRGNNRSYTLLDILTHEQIQDGEVKFSIGNWFYVENAEDFRVQDLSSFINNEGNDINVLLVGHSILDAANPLAGNEESLNLARSVRNQLIANGIDENRVLARGLGALAPAYSPSVPEQRVDVLLWITP